MLWSIASGLLPAARPLPPISRKILVTLDLGLYLQYTYNAKILKTKGLRDEARQKTCKILKNIDLP